MPFLIPGAFRGNLLHTTLVLVLVVRGIGMALGQTPAMTAAYASADEMGDAATLVNIVQRIGGAIGATGVVVTLARSSGADGAYGRAFALLAAVAFLAVVSAALLRRHICTRPAT